MPTLKRLHEAGHELALVVTQPDRAGDRLRTTPSPVKAAAADLGLALAQPERIRESAALEAIRQADPELMVVVAYGQIIPPILLELPPNGVLNVHASLLPRHRGAAPVAGAILAGDEITGVTVMQMDEQLDHGPVMAVRRLHIGPHEDAAQLSSRLADLGAGLLVDVLSSGLDGVVAQPQDHSRATLAPRLTKEQGELSWELPAVEIDRRVRAFQPWPGATVPFGAGRVRVLRGRPTHRQGAPGTVLASGGAGVEVATEEGAYLLEEVQLPGRRPMPAHSLLAAHA